MFTRAEGNNPAGVLNSIDASFQMRLQELEEKQEVSGIHMVYLQKLISKREEERYNLRSCAMGIMLQTPRTLTKKTLGDRAFLAAAPKLWNGLPSQIRNEPNFNRFKGLLKTHFFRLAFY